MVEDKSWGMLFVICDTRRSDIDNRVKSASRRSPQIPDSGYRRGFHFSDGLA
jgi:hypothetical protein